MDVRCDRCATEYEFDNALVSDRGTTVRCTNCGYQFKVYPERPATSRAREQWVVRKRTGAEVTYRSLKGLQKAITDGHVDAKDLFSKDAQPFRPLETVAELASFFKSPAPVPTSAGTLLGIQPARTGPVPHAEPPPPAEEEPPETAIAPTQHISVRPDADEELASSDFASVPEQSPMPSFGEEEERKTNPPPVPPRRERHLKDTLESARPPATEAELLAERRSSVPSPPMARVKTGTLASASPAAEGTVDPPSIPRNPMSVGASRVPGPYGESEFPASESRFTNVEVGASRARSRWIVGLVLLGALALVAATVLRNYLQKNVQPPAAKEVVDERGTGFVKSGSAAFFAGDLEAAKADFDKATVLSPKQADAYVWLARIEATRAERLWLLGRLIPEDDASAMEASKAELETRLGKLRASLDAARKAGAAGADLAAVEVDELRLRGDVDAARKLVSKLKQDSPEAGYVLAMLDLTSDDVAFETVTERLRRALSVERGLLRARAALVYALARAGKPKAATTELEKVAKDRELADALKAFVEKQPASEEEEEESATAAAAAGAPSQEAEKDAEKKVDAPAAPKDVRTLLSDAGRLKFQDPSQAEKLYSDVLSRQPGNVEALAGLGDIAKARGQNAQAGDYYDRVLRSNAGYLPALIGKADVRWAMGDRPGALTLYRQVLSQVGEGHPYGKRAKQRIDEGSGSAPAAPKPTPAQPSEETTPAPAAPSATTESAPPAPAPAPTTEPAPKPPEPSPAGPEIDTSDLP